MHKLPILLLALLIALTPQSHAQTGNQPLSGSIDLSGVAAMPSSGSLVLAGFSPQQADPYVGTPVWTRSLALPSGSTASFSFTNLPPDEVVLFAFFDANGNGQLNAGEKAARLPGKITPHSSAPNVTITFPADYTTNAAGMTAVQYFNSQAKPTFRAGTQLPHLLHSGWGHSNAVAQALTGWRTALWVDFIRIGWSLIEDRDRLLWGIAQNGAVPIQSTYNFKRNFIENEVLLAAHPGSYAFDTANNQHVRVAWNRTVLSPLASEALMRQVARERWGNAIQAARSLGDFTVDYLVNDGESGLVYLAEGWSDWAKDHTIIADYNASPHAARGPWDSIGWFRYISEKRGQQEFWTADEVRSIVMQGQTKRPTYQYYWGGYNPPNGRWGGSHYYGSAARDGWMKYGALDVSSVEFYFNLHNSGFTGMYQQQGVPFDMLTQVLNTYGGERAEGLRGKVPYVSPGWNSRDNDRVTEPDRFMGFLKCLFLADNQALVVSNFDEFEDVRQVSHLGGVVPANWPHMQWLWQYVISSHAHAWASQLEDHVTHGELLSSGLDHPYKNDAAFPTVPLYQFYPVGEYNSTDGVRASVVVNHLPGTQRYIAVAWANVGADRSVQVHIPQLGGSLTLFARATGSTYLIEMRDGTRHLQLLDPDGMNPSANMVGFATEPPPPAEPNLATNPIFANGDTGWQRWNSTRVEGGAAVGTHASRVDGPTGGVWQTVTGLEANTIYRLSVQAYASVAGQNVYLYAKDFTATGGIIESDPFTTGGFATYTVEFTTGPGHTSAEIGVWKASGPGHAMVDDFRLIKIGPAITPPPAAPSPPGGNCSLLRFSAKTRQSRETRQLPWAMACPIC